MKRLTKVLEVYIKNNKLFLLITLSLLVLGICLGSGLCVTLMENDMNEISEYLANFKDLANGSPNYTQIFSSALANALQLGLFMWLCGLTKLGIPIAPGIVGLKGFVCGFSVSSLIKQYSSVGLLASAIGILPQMIIMIPCIIVFSVSAMNQAAFASVYADKAEKRKRFMAYCLFCAMLILVLVLCSLIESYISPYLIVLALSIIQ